MSLKVQVILSICLGEIKDIVKICLDYKPLSFFYFLTTYGGHGDFGYQDANDALKIFKTYEEANNEWRRGYDYYCGCRDFCGCYKVYIVEVNFENFSQSQKNKYMN
jgi:hypothetical protein